MNADGHGLKFEQETGAIVSCAFEVLNSLGHGLLEKPYENALCVESGLRDSPWCQQPRCLATYKSIKVGKYVPDLIAFGFLVVDTKVVERITDHEMRQMLDYLKITGHPVGMILNFNRGRPESKRVINHFD